MLESFTCFLFAVVALVQSDQTCSEGDKTCTKKRTSFWDLPNTKGHVEIRDDIKTSEDFKDYTFGWGKPVLLKGAATKFPAFSKWTDDFMKESFGEYPVDAVYLL